ncbi:MULTISPECIES: uroporphyrinogen-III synthase [unclassified Mameliella]|uniref:uroporphyrinogen-III synthase n=1 Tax=unclassified Mameliella TaxID=2630630 RepID=UPI00273DFEA4|nr:MULTISPECIES: uroporphyrinogen-III synthase [unclassified Mameliella]
MSEALPVLLLTRPRAASERFAARLRQDGLQFRAVISPLFTVEVTGPLPDVTQAKGLIFTSANGVMAWQALGGRTDLPALAVGPATARAAQAAGMQAQDGGGSAEDLVRFIIAQRPPGPLVHLHGAHVRGNIAKRLSTAGIPCRGAAIYDQPPCPLNAEARAALDGQVPVVAPVFSPRTGELLAKECAKAPLLVAAMSQAVVNALMPLHKRNLKVAERPESEAMREVVSDLLNRALAGDY